MRTSSVPRCPRWHSGRGSPAVVGFLAVVGASVGLGKSQLDGEVAHPSTSRHLLQLSLVLRQSLDLARRGEWMRAATRLDRGLREAVKIFA